MGVTPRGRTGGVDGMRTDHPGKTLGRIEHTRWETIGVPGTTTRQLTRLFGLRMGLDAEVLGTETVHTTDLS